MDHVAAWITKNQVLLTHYKRKFVAITHRIVASGDTLQEVQALAEQQEDEFVLYYVPTTVNKVRIYPIHIKSVSVHEWQPFYSIDIMSLSNELFQEQALIDSGADISCFPYQLGLDLGFEKAPQEMYLRAWGIAGSVAYLQRQIKINIEGKSLEIPVAWFQEQEDSELILGRAVLFDHFDITFRQSVEKIEFTWIKK